jgi:hypothetical protein
MYSSPDITFTISRKKKLAELVTHVEEKGHACRGLA